MSGNLHRIVGWQGLTRPVECRRLGVEKARYRERGQGIVRPYRDRRSRCGRTNAAEEGSPYLAWVGSLRNGTDGGNAWKMNKSLAVLAPPYGEERDTARRKFCKTTVSAAGFGASLAVERARTAFAGLVIRFRIQG